MSTLQQESSGTEANKVAFRTCPLCEAGCGLEITVKNSVVTHIRGDMQDVFSGGFICPKGSTLKQLHDDPDRLRLPLVKRNGVHVQVSWQEAWAEVEKGLLGVINTHGRESVATYMGNPTAHNLSAMTFGRVALQAIGTKQRFSASTVDQLPKQVAGGYMFGTAATVPVPDLDRTQYLLMLGANPYASNGSMCTAPDFPKRLTAIQERGGKVVVVDPRKTRTAEVADEWLAIMPGTDGLFLAAIAHVLFADKLVNVSPQLVAHINGLAELEQALARFTPEVVADVCGLSAETIRRIAYEIAQSPTAAVYGRIGTTTVAFGTTTSWLVDVVNVLSGNLDTPGGAMFTLPVAGGATTRGTPGKGRGFRVGKGHTRVRHLPEAIGEYPIAALAEEVLTPGEGQIKALLTIAGNPVLSTPHSNQLDEALAHLDFMVSVDIYLNETTRHANVILPPPSHLQRDHYDLLLLQFAVRNVANYSEAILPLEDGQPDEWEILAKIAAIVQGKGIDADVSVSDDAAIRSMVNSAVKDSNSNICGRDAEEMMQELSRNGQRGPARMIDFMLRTGPYGDAFGAAIGGATLQLLKENPHGIDYGALQPRIPEILRTPSGKVELAPEVLINDLDRLYDVVGSGVVDTVSGRNLLLIGRRHLRSNNSWMHNINVLVKGKSRCTLIMHPVDALARGVNDGDVVSVQSRVGEVSVAVEISDTIRPGVVSLPHGWGHDAEGSQMQVALRVAGVNSNILTDHEALDPLSGTSVLNGIPVAVHR
ncbi:MAG: molybdopterin oxidoreductase family protein [Actinomycetes bacterium]